MPTTTGGPPPHPDRPPVVVIRPPGRWPRLNGRQLIRSHELLVLFAARDIKLRYRQTVLGAAWVVLTPALAAAVFSFVFSSVARLPSEHVPYFLFALVGMAAWIAFSNGLTRSSQALVTNAPMVTKIYFERLTLTLGTLLGNLIDTAIVLVIVAVAMVAEGVAPGVGLISLPLWLGCLVAMAGGLGLMAGALMVRYRDLQPIVVVGTQILLYASPVAYSATAVPAHLRTVFEINPLVGAIDGTRWALLDTRPPTAGLVAYSLVAAVVLGVLGLVVFRRQERGFADVI